MDSNKIAEQDMGNMGSGENVSVSAEQIFEPVEDSPDNDKSGQVQSEDVEMTEQREEDEDESDEGECGPSLDMMNS